MKKLLLVAASAAALTACNNVIDPIPTGTATASAPATLEITQSNAGSLLDAQSVAQQQSENPLARSLSNCFYGGSLDATNTSKDNGTSSRVEFTNCNQDGEWSLIGYVNTDISFSGTESDGSVQMVMTADVLSTHAIEPVSTHLQNYRLTTNGSINAGNVSSTTTMMATVKLESPEQTGTVKVYSNPMLALDIIDGQEVVSGGFYIEGANGTYISVDAATAEIVVNGEVFQQ